ncbi:MAG TPA: extracellular solute-binding protein [Burkholderiaceae bacterium]
MHDFDAKSGGALSRRALLRCGAAAAGLAAFGAPARAQSGELLVANWGGDWNDRTVRYVEAPLLESKGLKIVRTLNLEPERKTKLLAERSLPRGSIDVAHFSAGDAFELNEQEVLEQLDLSKIPNYAHVRAGLRAPYFVPWVFGGVTLAFNPKFIKEPPGSFAELWNPKYAGKVGVLDQSYYNWIYMAALVGGGKMNAVEPGFAKLAEMKRTMQPKVYPTHQQLAAAFANEEVWISANYSARIAQWAKDGVSVRSAWPKEGAVTIVFGATLPRRARNKDAAYQYLNALLDPRALGAYSAASMYAPATDNAQLSDDVRAAIDFTPAQQASLNHPDYGYQAKNLSQWQERWNKEFKG